MWLLVVAGSNGVLVGEDTSWPELLIELASSMLVIGPYLLVGSIVVATIAGLRGGRTRFVAVIAGIILLSPLIYFGVGAASYAIANH